jgi:hypothetical protein
MVERQCIQHSEAAGEERSENRVAPRSPTPSIANRGCRHTRCRPRAPHPCRGRPSSPTAVGSREAWWGDGTQAGAQRQGLHVVAVLTWARRQWREQGGSDSGAGGGCVHKRGGAAMVATRVLGAAASTWAQQGRSGEHLGTTWTLQS